MKIYQGKNNQFSLFSKVFPILVVLAYLADINLLICCKRPVEEQEGTIGYGGGKNQENLELITSNQNGTSDAKLVQQFMVQQKQTGKKQIANTSFILLSAWPLHNLTLPGDLDEEQAASALAHKLQGPAKKSHSRAYYRVQATRMLTAGAKIDSNANAKKVASLHSNQYF